jgi:hypothetical protein
MSERVVLTFQMVVVENPKGVKEHQRYRCEGIINEGLEQHFKVCAECRNTVAKDLRDFAKQIEDSAIEEPVRP